ncbi:hypothetical protein OGATHE_000504 [Ogataea polymorpha]|uniref:Uncharacterized protein n=1 Tax=Ogataea polymorpha TaxID=460523 RepID=A0A9P8PUJ4_9ASCO|nr:hypothetical protein OGATHE_000504 [Ogataea polymorpha]
MTSKSKLDHSLFLIRNEFKLMPLQSCVNMRSTLLMSLVSFNEEPMVNWFKSSSMIKLLGLKYLRSR